MTAVAPCLDELCAKLEDGHPLLELVETHPQFSEDLIRYQRERVRHHDLWRLLEPLKEQTHE